MDRSLPDFGFRPLRRSPSAAHPKRFCLLLVAPCPLHDELSAEELEAQRVALERYHRYLELFQSARSEEYAEIGAVLERYERLQAAHRDLLEEQQRLQTAVEAQRRALAKVRKALSTQTLTSENITGKMKERVEAARAMVLRLQQGADESALARSAKTLELGQILQSVSNLHSRCCGSSHGAVIKHTAADAAVLGYAVKLSGGPSLTEEDGDDEDGEHVGGDELHGDGGEVAGGAASPSPPASPAGAGHRSSTEQLQALEPPAPAPREDITGMDPASLRAKIDDAIGQLQVVGSYVVDFHALVDNHPLWLAELRRRQSGACEINSARLTFATFPPGETFALFRMASRSFFEPFPALHECHAVHMRRARGSGSRSRRDRSSSTRRSHCNCATRRLARTSAKVVHCQHRRSRSGCRCDGHEPIDWGGQPWPRNTPRGGTRRVALWCSDRAHFTRHRRGCRACGCRYGR